MGDALVILSGHYTELELQLARLKELMNAATFANAMVAPLAPTLRGQENEPVLSIAVETKDGKKAIDAAISAYSDLHIQPEFSTKSTRRTIGALWLQPSNFPMLARDLNECISLINNAKDAMKQCVLTRFESREERFDAIHAACAGVISLHLYRKINVFYNQNVSSVRMTWQNKSSLVHADKPLLVEKIKAELARNKGTDYGLVLEGLESRILPIQADKLRMRRPVKVQPAANVKFAGKTKTINAPLPLIVIQDEPVTIRLPSSYVAKERKQRSDRNIVDVVGTFDGYTIEALT
jgi:DNA replication terminus site-binding protein